MHRATLHNHVTRTADRLPQLGRHVCVPWVIGLVRRDKHNRARQEYIIISRAGPVLGHVSAVSNSCTCALLSWTNWLQTCIAGALRQLTMGALEPGGTSLNLVYAPWGKRIPPPGIGLALISDPALQVGTRSCVSTGPPNHRPPSSETRGISSVTTSTAGSELSTLLRPSGIVRLEVTMRRAAGRGLMAS